ncbi:hypothetical protein ABT127_27145 [Streptomyces sp. NPDC001904]|uniref:hypothetical protein n=1 Tax=Streptomyces sp. NPDC001904 TaxID=3154531 RepID=UPI00332F8835
MSSNEQYPYDPQHGQQYERQAGQQHGQQYEQQHGQFAQQPYEAEPTQYWQAQTWDTQVQPAPVQQQQQYQQQPYQQQQQQHQQSYVPQQQHEYGYGEQQGQPAQPQPQPAQPLPPQQEWSYEPAPQDPAPAPAPAPASEPVAADEPGYGPATVTGNTRVTDAQRARAEGRSPIIEPGIQPAGLTAVLGLLLAGGAAVGPYALLVPLVLLQAVTAAGWFRLNGMWPARQGIALAFLGGVVADIALLAAGREHAPAAILGTLGVWVLLTLVLQLRSHASPDERMYGLMATVVSAALAIVAAGHLAAEPDAVTVGAIAVAVAVVARALPLPTPASVVVALLAGAGAGIAAGGLTGLGSGGALLGLGAAAAALIGHRVASYDYPSRFVHMTAGVALPLAAAAPIVYVLGRVVG